jgi:hypothetical protein
VLPTLTAELNERAIGWANEAKEHFAEADRLETTDSGWAEFDAKDRKQAKQEREKGNFKAARAEAASGDAPYLLYDSLDVADAIKNAEIHARAACEPGRYQDVRTADRAELARKQAAMSPGKGPLPA